MLLRGVAHLESVTRLLERPESAWTSFGNAALDGRVHISFGRVRLNDPRIARELLVEELMIAALLATHPRALRNEPLAH
jgi:hypothetical protein